MGGAWQELNEIAWQANQIGRGYGQGPAISEDIFEQALQDAGLATVDDVVRVVDCRLAKLHDPGKQPGRKYHCGTWPDTFSTFCDAITPDEEAALYKLAEPLGKDIVDNLKVKVQEMAIHAHNYNACIEKVEAMINGKKQNKKGDK